MKSIRAGAFRAVKNRLIAPEVKARPSKTHFQKQFVEDIKRLSSGDAAADIASNTHQNSRYFNSQAYYGVDISEEALRDGLMNYSPETNTEYIKGPISQESLNQHVAADEPQYVSIEGDIRAELFPPSSLNLIVSSHTMHHIDPEYHYPTIELLCSYLRPGGNLLVQFSGKEWYTDRIRNKLEREFKTVETNEYKTAISDWYERIAVNENNRLVFPEPIGRDRYKYAAMATTSLALSKLEAIPFFKGEYLYVRALGKRE